MSENEDKLIGGNVADFVIRVGETVRKPVTKATPSVQALLQHLEHTGFEGAPRAFGTDEHGRQILEFVHGAMWDRSKSPKPEDLYRAGLLMRRLHDSIASFELPEAAQWERLSIPDGAEIICHNDLAPWNLVCGTDRWVFIDWDNAAPGTRLWDIAWSAISFPPLVPGGDLTVAAEAVRALCEGYRVDRADYGLLVALMARRARAASKLLIEASHTGEQPWARLFAENGDNYWGPVADYIDDSATTLERLLLEE